MQKSNTKCFITLLDIDFTKQTVFIDELPQKPIDISTAILFLRNLCRVAKIPTFVSGTDSRVGNMIGQNHLFDSRVGENQNKPWAIVNVVTSKAFLKSFSPWVDFKGFDGKNLNLNSFILRNNSNELDYSNLLRSINGSDDSDGQLEYFKSLAKFLILQAKTSLPGIISMVFSHLLALLSIHKNPRKLWEALNERVADSLSKRKVNIIGPIGLLGSAHILTFPSISKSAIEEGSYSAALVENHLFYYGTRQDTSFQLHLKYNPNPSTGSNMIMMKDGYIYEDKCYFPELNEDFFTTFACLNMWKIGVINEDKIGKKRWTMVSLYEYHLKSIHNYKLSFQKTVQNSLTFELLTYWSICHSSHQNLNGENNGVDVFKEFVKNLQKLNNYEEIGYGRAFFTGLDNLDMNLQAILKKIQVPYLMRCPAGRRRERTRDSLKSCLGAFIEIGESYLPPDKFGWDVVFNMKFNGAGKAGLIECKYYEKAIGYSGFFKYYKKQCESKHHPLAFFICRKLGKQISNPDAAEKLETRSCKRTKIDEFTEGKPGKPAAVDEKLPAFNDEWKEELYEPAEDHEKGGTSSAAGKPKKVIKDYVAMLNNLWTCPSNYIDIYTVKYDEVTINNEIKGKFTVAPLKTFLNSRGAFILVESNFTSHAPT